MTPVEIQLNWFPEAEHGGYYAAVVHGYYAEEGLEVTLKPGGPNFPLMENVATGRTAFGVDNADKLLRARAEEADVVAVFAPIQDSPRCIMAHEESGIKTLEDLQSAEGVTLAWNSAQPFAQFLSKKFDLSRLTMTKYSGSVGPFLLDKKYAQQAYNISEPFLARKEGAKPVALMLSDAGFNTYTSLLLTSRKRLTDDAELIRKVVRASQRGWQKYLADGELTNCRISALNPEMPIDVLTYGVEELQKLCRPDDLPESQIGKMDPERWRTLEQQLEEIQAVEPGSVQAAESFTTEFLPDAK
jgi:NitT/TauT family transport system substrate-binding protein